MSPYGPSRPARRAPLLSRTVAGHRELKNGAMAGPRLDPDLPAVALYDFLANCQTNSVSRILGPGVQSLEDNEDIFRVLRCNTDPVIAHTKQPLLARFLRLHGNRLLFSAELDP